MTNMYLKKILLTFGLMWICAGAAVSQGIHPSPSASGLYFVFLTDKAHTTFDPYSYFDQKAIERRQALGLSLYDSTDFPISPEYLNTISSQVDSVRHALRWLNAVSIQATPDQVAQIAEFPFVKSIQPFAHQMVISEEPLWAEAENPKEWDTLVYAQRNQMNLPLLESEGLTGKGVRIAIFDVGFRHVDTHPAFAHIRKRGGILKTRDFYGRKKNVYYHNAHGTQVLSCIAGMYGDRQLGCARDADFLLARTEHKLFEKPSEEDYWIAAAEWADKNGADIINSSLGYTQKRYEYSDMDGATAPVSKGASIAASKGILVLISNGNEGSSKWHYLGAPADSKDVLSIGGTFPFMRHRIRFSSFGPNAKGELKPNLSAPGYVLAAKGKDTYGTTAGTSFSCPLVAGFAACAMQLMPDEPAQAIFRKLEASGHLYPYFDYAHGYGVPDAGRLLGKEEISKSNVPTFKALFHNDSVLVRFDPDVMHRDSALHSNGRVLYYHFEKPDGTLDGYSYTIVPNLAKGYLFRWKPASKGILRIWFEGYLYERKNL